MAEYPGGTVVKDLALSLLWPGSLLWHGFDPWPENFCMHGTAKKKKPMGFEGDSDIFRRLLASVIMSHGAICTLPFSIEGLYPGTIRRKETEVIKVGL